MSQPYLPAIVPGDGKRTVSLNGGAQLVGGGAKKQRRVPSGRLQRQKAPSGLGCTNPAMTSRSSPVGGTSRRSGVTA